jgi:LL-diaminopimelate aminotransferase
MIAPAQRLASLRPHLFARLNQRKAELRAAGMDVIALDMGSPDLPPAPHIVEALARGTRDLKNYGYGEFGGSAEVRQAFAQYYAARFGVELDPQRETLLLLGSKEGIFHLSFAFLNPGDVALVPDPGYPTYSSAAHLAGATPYQLPITAAQNWLPDLSAIPRDVLRKAKLLWLNCPNNPTAATAPLAFFAEAVAFCRRHNLLLAHDNPYCDTSYDGYRAPSVLQVPGAKEIAVEFTSLSKSYNLAGLRIGALVGNAEAVKAVAALKSNVDTGAFAASQGAAVAALTGDQTWLDERNAIYQARRDLCVAALHDAGFDVVVPRATIYMWARIPTHAVSSAVWCGDVLEATGVSLTPGTAFGPGGEGYFRLALTAPEERLSEAMRRVVACELQRSERTTLKHAVLA